jgi:tRNA-2-methylthio-N6-dimethylallyladenosine synthase
MNIYDSVRMQNALSMLGYEPTEDRNQADILLLNTCHIREKASEKLYSEVGRLNEIKQERAKSGLQTLLIVAGCVVQAEGKELLSRAHAVDIAVGPQNYHRLPELVAKYNRKGGRILEAHFPAISKFDFLPEAKAVSISSYLAIQEGCDAFCSYCVVPYTRGCEYSRGTVEILKEARDLVKTGAKEIILLGQNVDCWHGTGMDGKSVQDLGYLIRHLADIDGLDRIRYTTSYPTKITPGLISAHRDVLKLMPYSHLPIQSGSNSILKAMNRAYTVEKYEEIIHEFRAARPDIAISSDFIVGFPGETDEDFAQTMDLVKRVKYGSSYSFKFSPRPGTPASLMKNQIPEEVKSQRLAILQELLLTQQKDAYKKMLGQTTEVLLSEKGRKNGQLIGYTPYFQIAHVNAPDEMLGQTVQLKITGATASSLSSEMISDIKR